MRKAQELLGPNIDVKKHFNPTYNPWTQRLCLAPNGDFFSVLKSGKASVATTQIKEFTENGVMTDEGLFEADVIITATGLNLQMVGGASIEIDGEKVDLSKR